jgi:hypothetical protein
MGQEAPLMALLHDAPEYVIGDMISPFKAALGIDYKAFEAKLEAAVHLRFGLPAHPPAAVKGVIKRADIICAYFEAIQLAGFTEAEGQALLRRPAAWHEAQIDADADGRCRKLSSSASGRCSIRPKLAAMSIIVCPLSRAPYIAREHNRRRMSSRCSIRVLAFPNSTAMARSPSAARRARHRGARSKAWMRCCDTRMKHASSNSWAGGAATRRS